MQVHYQYPGRRLLHSLATAVLGLVLSVGGAYAQAEGADLSHLIVSSDVLGAGWTLDSQGPDDAIAAFAPKPVIAYGALYRQARLTAELALYRYADRATALASPGFSDRNIYWGHGNTSFAPLTGYGDGPSYRAYPPGKGANSGITFVDGSIVVFVTVDGFDTEDQADAVANQLASAEDARLHSAGTTGAAPVTSQPAAGNSSSAVTQPSSPALPLTGRVVFVGPEGGLDIRDLASGAQQQIFDGSSPHQPVNPVWSPDGNSIALIAQSSLSNDFGFDQQAAQFVAKDDIYIVPSAGGEPQQVTQLGEPLHNLAWFPDGKHLLFGTGFNGNFHVHVLNLGDNSITDLESETDVMDARVSPDGGSIAALGLSGSIQVWNADGTNGRTVVDFAQSRNYFLSFPSWSSTGALAYGDNGSLQEAKLDGSSPTVIANVGTDVTGPVVYAPGGGRIAAKAVDGQQKLGTISIPTWGILLVNHDGSNAKILKVDGLNPGDPMEWAGGNQLLFAASSDQSQPPSLFVADGSGDGTPRVIVQGAASFDWHP